MPEKVMWEFQERKRGRGDKSRYRRDARGLRKEKKEVQAEREVKGHKAKCRLI